MLWVTAAVNRCRCDACWTGATRRDEFGERWSVLNGGLRCRPGGASAARRSARWPAAPQRLRSGSTRTPRSGQFPQAGVLGVADPVLAARPVGGARSSKSASCPRGWCRRIIAGQRVAVTVGEPQLYARVRLFGVDHDPHLRRPRGQFEHAGEFGDPGAFSDLAGRVVGRYPAASGIWLILAAIS